MKPTHILRLAVILALMLGLAWPALAAPDDDEPDTSAIDQLAQALELEETLDQRSRRLALELGQSAAFTQAPGRALRREGLLKLEGIYRQVLEANPDNLPARLGLARVLAALNRHAQALKAYQAALELRPGDEALQAEYQALKRLRATRASLVVSAGRYREYWPSAFRHLYATVERSAQVSVRAPLGDSAWVGGGWLQGSLEQHSLLYGDNDYVMSRRAPFVFVEAPLTGQLTVRARVRREIFSVDNSQSFYQHQGDEVLWTGYALMEYQPGAWWLNASLSRDRDTWPQATGDGRGVLRVGAQELWGVSAGRYLAPGWELAGSLFYETYSSIRPDQFNINGQVIHRPGILPDLRLALGAGHYTEENENLLNLQVGYQLRPLAGLICELTWQGEYLDQEGSLLSQLDGLLSWQIGGGFSLTMRASWGSESGDDHDEFWTLDLGTSLRF